MVALLGDHPTPSPDKQKPPPQHVPCMLHAVPRPKNQSCWRVKAHTLAISLQGELRSHHGSYVSNRQWSLLYSPEPILCVCQ